MHIVSGLDIIWMKKKCSMDVCSLKIRKLKISHNLKNAHVSAVSGPWPKPLGYKGHLDKGSQPCPFGQDH